MKKPETLWQAIGLLPQEMLEEAAAYTPKKKKKTLSLRVLAAAMASVIACGGIAWTAITFLPSDVPAVEATTPTPVQGNIMLYMAPSIIHLGDALLKNIVFAENPSAPENNSLLLMTGLEPEHFSLESLSAQVNGIPYFPLDSDDDAPQCTFVPATSEEIPVSKGQCVITLAAKEIGSVEVTLTPVKEEAVYQAILNDNGTSLTLAPVGQNLLFANLQNESWQNTLEQAKQAYIYALFEGETEDGELRYATSPINLNGTSTENNGIYLSKLTFFSLREGSDLLTAGNPMEITEQLDDIIRQSYSLDTMYGVNVRTHRMSYKIRGKLLEEEKTALEARLAEMDAELLSLQKELDRLIAQKAEHTEGLQKEIDAVQQKKQDQQAKLEANAKNTEIFMRNLQHTFHSAYEECLEEANRLNISLSNGGRGGEIFLYTGSMPEEPEDFIAANIENLELPSEWEFRNLASLDWTHLYLNLRYESKAGTLPLMEIGETVECDMILHSDALFTCRLLSATRTKSGVTFTTECTSSDPNVVDIQVEVKPYAPNAYISRHLEVGSPMAIYIPNVYLVYANGDGSPMAHIDLE